MRQDFKTMNAPNTWFLPSVILNARKSELALILIELAKSEEEFKEKTIVSLVCAVIVAFLLPIVAVLLLGSLITDEHLFVAYVILLSLSAIAFLLARWRIHSNKVVGLTKAYWEIIALPFGTRSVLLWDSLISNPYPASTPKLSQFAKNNSITWGLSKDIITSEINIQNGLEQSYDQLTPEIHRVNTGFITPRLSELPFVVKNFVHASDPDIANVVILGSSSAWKPSAIARFVENYRGFLQSDISRWADTVNTSALQANNFAFQRIQSSPVHNPAGVADPESDIAGRLREDLDTLFDPVARAIKKELARPEREIERRKKDQLRWVNTQKNERLNVQRQNAKLEISNCDSKIISFKQQLDGCQVDQKKIQVEARKLLKRPRGSYTINLKEEIIKLENQIHRLEAQRSSYAINEFEFSEENSLDTFALENSLKEMIDQLSDLNEEDERFSSQIRHAKGEISSLERAKAAVSNSLSNMSDHLDLTFADEVREITTEAEENLSEQRQPLTGLQNTLGSFVSCTTSLTQPTAPSSASNISKKIQAARSNKLRDLTSRVTKATTELQALHKKEREEVQRVLWRGDFLPQMTARYLVPFWMVKRAKARQWEVLCGPSWANINPGPSEKSVKLALVEKMPQQIKYINLHLLSQGAPNQFMASSALQNRAQMTRALSLCEQCASQNIISPRLLSTLQKRFGN